MANFTTLKIAELVRTPAGSIVLKDDYVPPCLAISASNPLFQRLRGLIDIFSAKANLLTGQRVHESGSGGTPFSLLHTLNTAIPILSHFIRIGKIHPEIFYRTLVQVAGSLASFSSNLRVVDLPAYHHTDLQKTFYTLDRFIRAIVEESAQSRHQVIPFQQVQENILGGTVSDERLFQSGQFFLSVSGPLSENQIAESIPRKIKMGSQSNLALMVQAALPGVRVYHTPRPPSTLSIQPGCQYFRIEQQGEHWEAICQSRMVAIYIPIEWKELKFELLVVKE